MGKGRRGKSSAGEGSPVDGQNYWEKFGKKGRFSDSVSCKIALMFSFFCLLENVQSSTRINFLARTIVHPKQ